MEIEEDAPEVSETAKGGRERSTVEFPYSDLDDAISIVKTIHDHGGVPMDRDQIAARLKQKAGSGAFVTKISAARMFKLVEIQSGSGKIQVTPLGYEAIAPDDGRQRAAKAQAFLNVELYRKLYEEFRNRHLPPRPLGLEAAMVSMGVAPKQKTNARYAFDRSAKQAGFFDAGQDRLVAPVVPLALPPSPDLDVGPSGEFVERALAPPSLPPEPQKALDGVIMALIEKLPPSSNKDWSLMDRLHWLQMMAMAFDMAYGRKGRIAITAEATGPQPGGVPAELRGSPKGVAMAADLGMADANTTS